MYLSEVVISLVCGVVGDGGREDIRGNDELKPPLCGLVPVGGRGLLVVPVSG